MGPDRRAALRARRFIPTRPRRWGKRCFGWNITMPMCYPPTVDVGARIAAVARARGVRHVFLATDSPRRDLFEDVLATEHGVRFKRYGHDGPKPTLGDEFALPVDTLLCAQAAYFLGNVPSTVTATIVQERDNLGWDRERSDFFGFEPADDARFRDGWEATDAFAAPAPCES